MEIGFWEVIWRVKYEFVVWIKLRVDLGLEELEILVHYKLFPKLGSWMRLAVKNTKIDLDIGITIKYLISQECNLCV